MKASRYEQDTETTSLVPSILSTPTVLKSQEQTIGVFFNILFYLELFVFVIWIFLSMWAVIFEIEFSIEMTLASLHFSAPIALLYSYADFRENIKKNDNIRSMSADFIRASIYVAITVIFVDAISLTRVIVENVDNLIAFVYCAIILFIFFIILSAAQIYWLILAKKYVLILKNWRSQQQNPSSLNKNHSSSHVSSRRSLKK